MAERIYPTKENATLTRTDLCLVTLRMEDGTEYPDLEPRRLFPVRAATQYITLLGEGNREVGIIRDLADLDEDSRRAVEECLDQYYLIPEITALLEITDRAGALTWHVMTDRGEISFRIRNRHADIKLLYGTHRVLVRDSDDNRYEIPDLTVLDKKSQKLLFYYI